MTTPPPTTGGTVDRHRSPTVYGPLHRFDLLLASVEALVEHEPDSVFEDKAVAAACDRLAATLRQRAHRI